MADDTRPQVSTKYPSLVELSTLTTSTLTQLKSTAKQLSKGGTTQDAKILAATQPPPVLHILSLLEQLQQEIKDDEHVEVDGAMVDALGLRDRRAVAEAVDLVMVFGVQPGLLPGVGVPLARRVRSQAAELAQSLQRQMLTLAENTTDDQRLPAITLRLARIVRNRVDHGTADVAHALLGKCTDDLLAALLQTAYAPLPPPNTQAPAAYLANIECDEHRRIELRKEFTRIFDSCGPHVLLESLTTLLNAAVSHKPQAPRWFATLCSRFLTRVLLRPGGARITVDYFVANDADLTTQKLERITSLLLTPAAGADPEEYYARVLPQVVEMADVPVQMQQQEEEDAIGELMNAAAVRRRVAQVAVYALQQLAERNPGAFARYVVEPVVPALMRWFTTRALPSANGTFTDDADATAPDEPADPVIRGLRGSGSAKPLIQIIDEPKERTAHDAIESAEVSSSAELDRALERISQLVLQGVPSVSLLAALVVPVFTPLLHWYAYELSRPGRENTCTMLRDVLVTTLAGLPQTATISTVLEAIQQARDDGAVDGGGVTRDWAVFSSTDAGGTQLVWRSADTAAESQGDEQPVPVDALLEMLGAAELHALLGDVFVTLLREQQALLQLVAQGSGVAVGVSALVRKWWAVSQATLAMVERFGPAVLTRHADVLAFIFDTLERSAEVFASSGGKGSSAASKGKSDEQSVETLLESLSVGGSDTTKLADMLADAAHADEDAEGRLGSAELVVLALMLLGQVLTASEQQAFAALAPALAQKIPDGGAAQLPKIVWDGEALRHLRGILAQLQRLEAQAASALAQMAGEVRVQAVMILALNGGSSGGEKSAKDGAEADDAADGEVRRFNAAVRDIRDELAPVRAHGILELRNMVLARSPVLQAGSARLEATISLFVDMVKSPDSFVHLNAVRGLAALADAHGRLFIPRLVAMYCGGDAGSQGIPSLDEHVRVGEALMQSVRRAGMMLGEYAELVVPALLDEVRREHVDAESAVRRHSALAILAMCAETSALALHRWVGEITAVVEDILLVAEPVVRRAAVVLWQSLVRGYGDRVQRLVEPRELRRMYGVLRRTADGDTDEITQMQAHIAVADLDDLVRDQLFTQYL